MNVTSTPAAAPANSAPAAGRDPNSATPDDSATDDTFGALVGLLTQSAAAAAAPVAAPAQAAVAAKTGEGTDDEDAVDWALPFLAPAPVTPQPTPLDYELPDPGLDGTAPTDLGGGGGKVASLSLPSGGEAKLTEPQLDLAGAEAKPTAAGLEVAVQVTTRVEATGTPGAHAVVRTVHVPVADSRWPAHVGHEVRLLIDHGVQSATLRVTPEQLGPVDIRIDIVNDKANVVFGAAQAETRAALTDAIPKLREMFAGTGLSLGDAGVRQESPGAFGDPSASRTGWSGSEAPDSADDAAPLAVRSARIGLVDAYA